MAHEDQESISIGNYLLERLSQIGVQASSSYNLQNLLILLTSTGSRSSVSLETSIWVSPSLIFRSQGFVDDHPGFLVCPAIILYALFL